MKVTTAGAARLLLSGLNVALPTETVYGLAASLQHPKAIEQIFRLKGRPLHNPLIVHLSENADLTHYVTELSEAVGPLAAAFWPGPLTLILPANCAAIPHEARAGLPTVAIRIPFHPAVLEVLRQVGPLVMPSANLSGKPSATTADHVEADFGIDFPVLDGGPCQKGIESTILGYEEERWTILRPGAITLEQLAAVLGYQPVYADHSSNTPKCPGQLLQHYAPEAKLILDENADPAFIGTVVGFSNRRYPESCKVFVLGSTDHPEGAARQLYAILRQLDRAGIQTAWVDMCFPKTHLWQTIKERLQRAAARLH